VIYRPNVRGVHNQLKTVLSGWDSDAYMLSDWYREA